MTLANAVREAKVQAIRAALAASDGNRTRAARTLGVTPGYLLRLIPRLGIAAPPRRYFWGRRAVIDLAEARALARRHSLGRSAELLGVHFSTLATVAAREGIAFPRVAADGLIRRRLAR